MIDSPITLVLLGIAAVSAITAFSRRRPRGEPNVERTKQLTAKVNAATREVDEHIAAYLKSERKGGGGRG